jgi:hypothetical protein
MTGFRVGSILLNNNDKSAGDLFIVHTEEKS